MDGPWVGSGRVGSKEPDILAGRVSWVTISVGRVGSQNLDPRATLIWSYLSCFVCYVSVSLRSFVCSAVFSLNVVGVRYALLNISKRITRLLRMHDMQAIAADVPVWHYVRLSVTRLHSALVFKKIRWIGLFSMKTLVHPMNIMLDGGFDPDP